MRLLLIWFEENVGTNSRSGKSAKDEGQSDLNVWKDEIFQQLSKINLMTNSPMTCSEPLAKKVCSHEAMDVTPKAVKSNGTKQNGHSTPTKGGDDVPMADAVGDASNSDAETTPGRRGRPSRGSRSASRTTDEETDSRAPATRTSARLRSSRK